MLTAKKIIRGWRQVLVTLLLMVGCVASAADSKPVGEYQVKAVFVYNFTKFVQWPTNAMTATNSPFVIGIVGEDPFGTILDDVVRSESVGGHPIRVRRFHGTEKIEPCQILFIAHSENSRLPQLLAQFKDRDTLTVADSAQAAECGVMVNLMLVEGSVKMEINQSVVESTQLSVSSKLMNLARIVSNEKDNCTP